MEKGVVKAFRKVKGLPGWQAFIFTFHVSFLVFDLLSLGRFPRLTGKLKHAAKVGKKAYRDVNTIRKHTILFKNERKYELYFMEKCYLCNRKRVYSFRFQDSRL